ncbi:MAG: lambda repressor-like predicted transcriptional regulator [Flavobacteriales bacterium]|jgi:lambda repressor-like predicted transcriptional regulator
MFLQNEDGIGERRAQALEFNKVGLQKYTSKKYVAVTGYFYQAYLLFHENWLSALIYCRASRPGITFLQESEHSGIFNRTSNRVLNQASKKGQRKLSVVLSRKNMYILMLI